MTDELLLALDLGTGSCRALLFDVNGHQLALAQQEYVHAAVLGVPGAVTFDTDAVWALLCACIREVMEFAADPAAIRAVSTTSMREGMVLYDARGREIWACPNADGRAGTEAAELVYSGEAREIFELAGDWVAITAPPRLRWLAKHEPELFASIAHMGMVADWALTRLCGEYVTDPSLGSSSAMFDLAQRDWSDRILDLCGLDHSVVPPVSLPGTVVGEVTRMAADQTGLAAGTPVVVGGGDTQLGLLGMGRVRPGQCTILGGSFWQTTAVLDRPLVDPKARLRTLCHAIPDRWMIEGIGFWSGLVMRWFRDSFCELEVAEGLRRGIDPYDLLEEKAGDIPPGSNGLFGIFANVMRASQWAHAAPAFIGYDVTNPARTGRIESFRAIQEAAAYVSRAHHDLACEITDSSLDDIVFAGGAGKGGLWPQIVSDVLDRPMRVPRVKEATALGAAILAGVGVGLYDHAATVAEEIVDFERVYEPDSRRAEAYRDLYHNWRDLYARALDMSASGLVRPLWEAPIPINSHLKEGL